MYWIMVACKHKYQCNINNKFLVFLEQDCVLVRVFSNLECREAYKYWCLCRAGQISQNLWCAIVEYENDAIICLCLHSITLSLRTTQHLQLYAEKKMILLACWFRSIYAKAMCLLRLWPCYSTRRTNTVLCSAHILDGYLCTYSYYVNDVIKTSIQTRFIWWSVCIRTVL